VNNANLPKQGAPASPIVVRSNNLPQAKEYQDFREVLRYDFLHSCAYCTMSESEGGAVRFTIDHYEPQSARPDLENDYNNLFWACDECNSRKGDLTPPPSARQAGIRFFRIDQDIIEDHFELSGARLKHRSPVGDFTIEYVDLNRQALRRLRDIRRRLAECDKFVQEGVFALKSSRIDRLSLKDRGHVFTTIMTAARVAEQLADGIDKMLRDIAKSELIDPDPESAERATDRKRRMKELKSLHDGEWRGRDF
jgi:hypothetical protein